MVEKTRTNLSTFSSMHTRFSKRISFSFIYLRQSKVNSMMLLKITTEMWYSVFHSNSKSILYFFPLLFFSFSLYFIYSLFRVEIPKLKAKKKKNNFLSFDISIVTQATFEINMFHTFLVYSMQSQTDSPFFYNKLLSQFCRYIIAALAYRLH